MMLNDTSGKFGVIDKTTGWNVIVNPSEPNMGTAFNTNWDPKGVDYYFNNLMR